MLTVCSCCRMYPFSHTSCETCFCRRSFSSINSLFIADNFLFTVWSREASFLCFSRHLHSQTTLPLSLPTLLQPKTSYVTNPSCFKETNAHINLPPNQLRKGEKHILVAKSFVFEKTKGWKMNVDSRTSEAALTPQVLNKVRTFTLIRKMLANMRNEEMKDKRPN